MAVTPQYQGKYGKPWTISLNTDSGADNITGISAGSITVVLYDANNPASVGVTSTGAVSIVTANPAVIQWQPTAPDYANVGVFEAEVNVTFPTGPVTYDPVEFAVIAH